MKRTSLSLFALTVAILSYVSFANAGAADTEYSRVKAAASRLLGGQVRENTVLTSKGDRGFVLAMAQAYREMNFPAINTDRVFSLIQTTCEDVEGYAIPVAGSVTAGCLTDAIIQSRKR